MLFILLLAVTLVLLLAGCGARQVTFDDIFSDPEKYNGKNIVLEGFFFQGFESILLCEELKYSGYAEGHLIPAGKSLWVEGGIPKDIYDLLYRQEMMGPLEVYGKLRIKGRFAFGGEYGHVGDYSSQITPSQVEILPWTPPLVFGK